MQIAHAPLPYACEAVEPISAEALEVHHARRAMAAAGE